jgi:hypothetical protein
MGARYTAVASAIVVDLSQVRTDKLARPPPLVGPNGGSYFRIGVQHHFMVGDHHYHMFRM